jgi:hypothetical protein
MISSMKIIPGTYQIDNFYILTLILVVLAYDLIVTRRIFLHSLFLCFGVILLYPLFSYLFVLLQIEARS